MYPRLVLASPSRYLSLPGFPFETTHRYVSASEFAAYLKRYAVFHGLTVEELSVTSVSRATCGFEVSFADTKTASCNYRIVVVGTGMYANPVIPSIVQEPSVAPEAAPTVLSANDWPGPEAFFDKAVLIVGDGMRAVELAEECASAGIRVALSTRTGTVRTRPRSVLGIDLRLLAFPLLSLLPLRSVRAYCLNGWRFPGVNDHFARFHAEGRIVVFPELVRLRGRTAQFADDARFVCDVVVLATGYRFDMRLLHFDLHLSRQGYPLLRCGESETVKDLFFIGIPCAFRPDSQFIHGMARDATVLADIVAARLDDRM